MSNLRLENSDLGEKFKRSQVDMINRQPERVTNDRWAHIPSGAAEVNLLEAFRVLIRRKWLILLIVLILTGLILWVLLQLTPRYIATAEIVFDAQPSPMVDFQAALTGKPQDEAAILSEIEIIKSRKLAHKVVYKLELDTNPEFNASLREENEVASAIRGALRYVLNMIKREPPSQILSAEQIRQRELERVVDAFLERVSVARQGESRVVKVTFESENSELAATGANAIVELYLLERLEGRYDTVQRASNWLADQVLKLREKVEASEESVEQYRQRYGLLRGEQYTLLAEEISDLNAQLTEARVELTQAQADLSQGKRLKTSAAGFGSANQVLVSPLIQDLRIQEAELERKEAELSQEYGPRHPTIININAEQKKLRAKLAAEVSKIYGSLENRVEVALTREAAIAKDLQKLKDRMAQADSASIGLRMLEREAEANRVMLEKLQVNFMETNAQEYMESLLPIARIISFANVPEFHSFPKRTLFAAFGLVGSIIIAVMFAFILEQLDRGFRGAEQVERDLNVPVLASVPLVPGFSNTGDPSEYILKNPSSAFAESVRSIYVRAMLASSAPPPRTFMLVSSKPDEGKSTIALSLALLRQKAGQKVIIVDADFRRPVIAEKLGLQQTPGLMDFLAGQADLKEVLQQVPASGVDVIAAGTYAASGSDLLVSENMKRLLERLRERYDLVIIDSAPTLSLSDPQVLSRMADRTILVVRWGKTHRHVVNNTINTLVDAGAQIAGVALSMVDLKKHARYGFGDSGNYQGEARKYYAA